MSWSSIFLILLGAALVYIYRKKLIDYDHLVDGIADIDMIKLGYMSSAGIDLSLNNSAMNKYLSQEDVSSSDHIIETFTQTDTNSLQTKEKKNDSLPVPEVLVKYSYSYHDTLYHGESYISLISFLGDLPFYLDFEELGNDFPVLHVPQGDIVGEESIENFLLSLKPDLSIQIDSRNPHLSFIEEDEIM